MRGVDVLIATPGRLLDHFERGRLLMSGVELLVIDEADRMLDMGFIPDIERICKLVPFTRQTLFFTATMPPEIRRITEQFLHNPVKVEVSRPATAATTITQKLIKTGRETHEKRDVLRRLIKSADPFKNAIIFCNRKTEVATLHRSLVKHGFNAVCLHGDMEQSARTAALDKFRKGEASLLVASDVAARGLDIPDVSHVFNFDVPHHPDDYIHRIGRTGRAGKSGVAITIASPADQKSVAAIEKLTGMTIEASDDAQFDPTAPQSEARHNERESGKSRGGRSRHGRDHGKGQKHGQRRDSGHAASHDAKPAPVARIDEARRKQGSDRPPAERAPERAAEPADTSHLPAFLLRPIRVKA
jgi:superfamily II DNA/RNA helicase